MLSRFQMTCYFNTGIITLKEVVITHTLSISGFDKVGNYRLEHAP